MNPTAQRIIGHAKNGVVLLSVLKERNYPLFKYFIENFKRIRRMLHDNDYYVLNDLRTLNTDSKLKYFLKYSFEKRVNLGVLREYYRNVYNYLSKRGEPEEIVQAMGFKPTWNIKSSDAFIKDELYLLADAERNIIKIENRRLYSKLYYRARKKGQTLQDYVKQYGYTYRSL